ncbi:hypothetical protein [Engelhardtia mirabilis]|uniref:Uncharacterized protein n=1 Tax=Engelhardtia mirabilis TaxID=2528011 RepID=A0A518BHI8_9BACT|nr:hypothetical protein Pla133_15210 [Planctomycetes bacterium Pla133]QDV00773.1 hypothetical protein Pla86_15200 [Planctomycetes bacterium Pla86]
MEHERLEPGTHLRKNQKQILAMLRASAARAGLVWDANQQTGSRTAAVVRREEGGDELATATIEFSTDGVRYGATPTAGEAVEALALYTDTRWMMETHEALLAAVGGS